jgi:hypothetical protein
VPVQSRIDDLEAGHPLDHFPDAFPSVTREHAVAVLESPKHARISPAAWPMRMLLRGDHASKQLSSRLSDRCDDSRIGISSGRVDVERRDGAEDDIEPRHRRIADSPGRSGSSSASRTSNAGGVGSARRRATVSGSVMAAG